MLTFEKKQIIELVENLISIQEVHIDRICIGSDIKEIPIKEIVELHISLAKDESKDYIESNYTITERFEMFRNHKGWIHMAGGMTLEIKDAKVESIKLSKRYIENISHYTRKDLISNFGQPDFELEDAHPWSVGTDIEFYILVYRDKNINFFIDPNTNKLSAITSRELDKSHYGIRVI